MTNISIYHESDTPKLYAAIQLRSTKDRTIKEFYSYIKGDNEKKN